MKKEYEGNGTGAVVDRVWKVAILEYFCHKNCDAGIQEMAFVAH